MTVCNSFSLSPLKLEAWLFPRYKRTDESCTRSLTTRGPYMKSFEALSQTRCACSGTVIELSSVPHYSARQKERGCSALFFSFFLLS